MNDNHSFEDFLSVLENERIENPNLHITVPSEPKRTLFLLGHTRAGKTTIFQTIENTLSRPDRPSLYSATQKPSSKDIRGLRIIDMPGFNDIRIQTEDSLTNNEIVKILKEQLTGMNSVSLFAFVFNLQNGIKTEDIEAMILVQSELPELVGRTMLVITHAEELDNRQKIKLVQEFFSHPLVKKSDLQVFFQQDILFVGCLRYESFHDEDQQTINYQHQNVSKMRQKLIEKCFGPLPEFKQQHTKDKSTSRYSVIAAFIIALFTILWLLFMLPSKPNESSTNPSKTALIDALFTGTNRIESNKDNLIPSDNSNEKSPIPPIIKGESIESKHAMLPDEMLKKDSISDQLYDEQQKINSEIDRLLDEQQKIKSENDRLGDVIQKIYSIYDQLNEEKKKNKSKNDQQLDEMQEKDE